MEFNKSKVTCIQHTIADLGVSLTMRQVTSLLAIASNQGKTVVEISRETGIPYCQLYANLKRFSDGGVYNGDGYQVKGLKLVRRTQRRARKRGLSNPLYLTAKGTKFIKRLTRNKR